MSKYRGIEMKNVVVILISLACQLYSADAGLKDRNALYRLQTSDQVDLSYRYSPEYDETLQIQPDGYASVKLIGPVKLAGLTLEEAHSRPLEAVRSRLHDPEITVNLKDFVRPSYVVAGQVGNPGKYELHGEVTAVEAIAIAGGFKDSAKHSQVILFRRVNAEMAQTRTLDLKRLMNARHPHLEEDIRLQPGDLLVVPKNRVSKIADYVHWVSLGSYIPL
jgi:polysaccharide biosynthesis/export protein